MSERNAMTDTGAGRVLGALVAPGDTFRSIAARPTWLAPLLVLTLLATVVGWMVANRIDMAQTIRHQLEASGAQLSAEQIDQRIETVKKFTPVLALVQGLVVVPVVYLVLALLLWVGFKLLGSELGYKASFSTALHGTLPQAVQGLISIPVVWNRATIGAAEARSGAFLASNLGAFAPDGTGAVARALLGSVDLFSIWAIVLLIIGYRAVARVSGPVATGVVLAIWFLGIAVKVALVAISPG